MRENRPLVEKEGQSASRVLTHPIAWVPALIGGILALIDPSAFIDNKLILLLAKFSAIYTGIKEFAKNSSLQSEALVFYAIVFSAFPFQLIFLWMKCRVYGVPELMVRSMIRQPYSKRVWLLALAPIGVVVGYFGIFFTVQDPSFCAGCTTSSTIGMIVITAGEIIVEIFICLATFILLINARKILSRTPKE